ITGFLFSECVQAQESPGPLVGTDITSRIDREIASGYSRKEIEPSDLCSDEEFVRRVYLDLAGRIPTVAERDSFMKDRSVNKRLECIDRLLASEDYVQNLTDTFDSILMGRGSRGKIAERKKVWRPYLENVFRNNRPWDQVAREILLARPESPDQAGAVWYLFERQDNAQAIAEAVAPAFFGIRIDCAQCHDHMIASEIRQQHYWGLVAFFNRSKNQKTDAGPRINESAIGGFSEFANIQGASSPNLLTFFASKTVEESRPEKDAKQEDVDDLYRASPFPNEPRVPKFSRRERFVDEILSGHPMFAKAFVNRLWAILMGRGIVHPFDQMDSMHDPSHPGLLEGLSQDFVASGYDIRNLVRGIAASRPYQLSSKRPRGVDDPALFAWSIERSLTAEQLARSIQIALQQRVTSDHPLLPDLRERMPDVVPEAIVTDVGDALFLTNNPTMHQVILEGSQQGGLIARLAEYADPKEAIEELFVAVFGRLPEGDEADAVSRFLQRTDVVGGSDSKIARWQNVVWATLTSAEFRFNH
ncbi:MAG: DUF1549 domain-containing protein, partial [Planctomycetes bacterium]|nr:DUF1549 domain-containing protein [Planctomycetota bacterium]